MAFESDTSLGLLAILPPEVRQIVYAHTFSSLAETHRYPPPGQQISREIVPCVRKDLNLPPLGLSKKINEEAIPILLQNRTIKFDMPHEYRAFLNRHSKAYTANVRSIQLTIPVFIHLRVSTLR